MMDEVPGDYSLREELSNRMASVKTSSLYAAPETVSMWWNKAAFTLSDVLGEPNTPWKKKVAAIFADKEDV